MEVDCVDPSTVNKNPKLIKDAQEDASKLDILVCGTCRNVFHFIEDFKSHKENPCPTSTYSSQETKPQVWAFLLWKSAIVNKEKAEGGGTNVNAWKMYQEWSKMEEEVKENWITAGKALQSFSMIASAKLQEVRSPNDGKTSSVRTVGEVDSKDVLPELKQEKKLPVEKGSSEVKKGSSQQWNNVSSDVGSNKVKTSIIKKDDNDKKETNDSIKEPAEGKSVVQGSVSGIDNENNKPMSFEGDDTIEIKEEKLSEEEGSRGAWEVEDMDITSEVIPGQARASEMTFVKKKSEPPRPDSNKVTRRSLNRLTNEGSSEDEYVVEKILAKRFNPKKKYYEYLLKWEGYPHEQNTWEPVHNMAACDKLVETFERNLAKQKAAQQAQIQAQKSATNSQNVSARKIIGHSSKETVLEASPGPSGLESRPVRSSKKKALEQVKSWCGSMAKTTEFGKRKVGESSDSDEDDISEKKVKLEPPDDDDWSSGELACSQGSSGEENVVAIHGNQAKVVGVIHKAKEQLLSQSVKRTPGRPRKLRPDDAGAVNGMKPRKSDEANDLAVKLGLESDSSPESKSRSPQSGNKATSQPPVLVANSKGVIKVDPRQVPNLTSGVYIVANKSNVVKLESLPSSPPKGKIISSKTPPGKAESSVKPGLTSGIVRKAGTTQIGAPRLRPLAPAPPPVKLLPKPTPGQLAGVLLGGPGLMKVAPQLTQRTVITSPRSVATSPRILGPRPTAVLQPRGTLLQSPLRPNTPGSAAKRPIGIPGVQTKITSAVRPRFPTAGKVVSPLTAQTKSGVKPIQAMLGKAVQGQSLASAGLLSIKKNGEGLLKSGIERVPLGVTKPGVRLEDDKPRKGVGRGRGRGGSINVNSEILGKSRDSKLSDNDNLHMEFHELSSSESESDDSLPELPMGDLPSLEPDSPPRPFTLCPETGKILGRAEGEPSPPPSPVPDPEPPAPSTITVSSASTLTVNTVVTKQDDSPAPGAHESEEILPDRREEASPLSFSESNETLLKVEMSPGGTTGTVIESSVPNSQFVDTLRTEQGVTVTKISAEMGSKTSDEVVTAPQPASPTTGKAGGGISVPARKLFMEGGKLNSTEVVTVTGEDGVVYQIATEGHEEIEGEEGMQQCVYVTTDQAEGSEEGTVLTLDTAVAEAVAQLMPDQVNVIGSGCSQFYIKESEDNSVEGGNSEQLVMASVVDQPSSDDNAQVVAHVVQEGEIIPGTGKRRVVLLLPDGNLMMTDVDEEQYAALNLDK